MTGQFPQAPYEGGPATPSLQPRNAPAIAAIVVGAVAFVFGWIPIFGLIMGLAAVVLGVLGIRRAASRAGRGRGLGFTSITLGALAALTSVIVTVVAVAVGSSSDTVTSAASPAGSSNATEEPSAAPAPSPTAEPSTATPSPEATTQAPATPSPTAAPVSPTSQAATLGVPVTSGDLTFLVSAVSCGIEHVGSSSFGADAQGQYCQVDLSVTNNGNEANYFTSSQATLLNTKGQKYSASSDSIYLDSGAGLFDQINPGNTLTGSLLFDVPDGADLDSLQLRDGLFEKAATVPV